MKEFLSIQDVADMLGVDYKTIYRLVQKAEITAAKIGGVYRIPRGEVDAYYERQRKALVDHTAKAAQIKCGRCLRLFAPYEIVGACEAPGCDQPLCRTCWDDDPDHRCRPHVLSRKARLQRAQEQLGRDEIPLALTSEQARRRELLYLSRAEAKLRELDQIPDPGGGRPLRVGDWDNIVKQVEGLHFFRDTVSSLVDEASMEQMPANPRHSYWVADRLMLEVMVYSDLATHLKQGFVTHPPSVTILFDLLREAIGRCEEKGCLMVLGLASTAGWDRESLVLIQGDGAKQLPFHHRLLAPVLVDLQEGELIYNEGDRRLTELAPLFSAELAIDAVQELMGVIEEMFAAGRTGILESELVEQGRAPAEIIAEAFDRLQATGRTRIEKVDKRDRLLLRRSAS